MKRLSEAFEAVFSDNEWFNKVLVGGFWFLLLPFGIGAVMINGYLEEFSHRARNGEKGLPLWRNVRSLFRSGLRKSLFPFLVLVTLWPVVLSGQFIFTITNAISLLVLFLTINSVLLVRSWNVPALALSLPLLIVAVSIGWMWIVVGWPLLIFLALLVQTHLLINTTR